MAEKATHRMTGRMRNHAFWLTGFMLLSPRGFARRNPFGLRYRSRVHVWAERGFDTSARTVGDVRTRPSCHQLLVLVVAGMRALHAEPGRVADGGWRRVRAQACADHAVAGLGSDQPVGADVL